MPYAPTITLQGKAKAKQLSIVEDACIEGLKRLTDVIHQNGTKAMAQINHVGSAAPSAVNGGRIVSASGVILPTNPMMGDGAVPEELTKEQIAEIVYLFGQAARRAMEAGYDAVELLEKFSRFNRHRTRTFEKSTLGG